MQNLNKVNETTEMSGDGTEKQGKSKCDNTIKKTNTQETRMMCKKEDQGNDIA